MKTAFKILPQLEQDEAYHLIVEVGWDAVSLVYFTRNPMCIQALYIYHVAKDSPALQLAEELGEVFRNESLPKYTTCHICYNFKECTLVPTAFFKESNLAEMISVLHGENNNSSSFAQQVNGMDLIAAHRVDKRIEFLLSQQFPAAQMHHSLALLLPVLGREPNNLFCTIYQHSIKVILFKNGVLQIARFFDYTTPADVAYHLLNVCAQHGFSPESGRLLLSGYIDHKSNLYDELYRYFLNIELDEGNKEVATAQAVSQYPVHFFSPLTLLATCVS